MTLKYCRYPLEEYYGTNPEGIAVRGMSKEEVASVLKNGVIREVGEEVHVLLNNTVTHRDDIIQNQEIVHPCDLCKHRLTNITTGCKGCAFENKDVKDEVSQPQHVDGFIEHLNSRHAVEYKPRAVVLNPFQKTYQMQEISLDEEVLEEIHEKRQEQKEKATLTKRVKKEHCSECVYRTDKNGCALTVPSSCQGMKKVTEEDLISRTLADINDRDRLLKLSTYCGKTIRYQNRRYRLSYVHDEVMGTFVATRDYTPWDEVYLSLSDVREQFSDIDAYLESPLRGEQDTLNTQAVTLHLLRENWHDIYRIEHYQKQHMFYATFNDWKQRVDIEIHQSKHTFPYHYTHPRELTATTRTIWIP